MKVSARADPERKHDIRHTGRPLGRKPKKEKLSRYQKEKQRKE